MKKSAFWKADWFLVLIVAIVLFLMGGGDLIQSLERKAYDLGVQATSRIPSSKVAVIAIDDRSIENIGRWPWSREVHAKMIDLLAGAKAKVIGYTVFFSEPQVDPGLNYINKLTQLYANSGLKNLEDPTARQAVSQIGDVLKEAEQNLNTDRKLEESIQQANNVLLAMLFQIGEPMGKPDHPLPEFIANNQLSNIEGNVAEASDDLLPLPTTNILIAPLAEFGENAVGIGHLNASPDVDGGIRTEPLVLSYYDKYFPSLSLMLAAKSLNLQPSDIEVRLGEGVKLGNLKIATDPNLQMYIYFYKDRDNRPAFPVDSFYDVYAGKIPADKYRDKIVLIGATAAGVGAMQVTPISPAMAPVLTLAHSVSSILQEDFFVVPRWGPWAERTAYLLIALYLVLLLPRLKAGTAAFVTFSLLAALLGTQFGLMVGKTIWVKLMLPATLLLVGHLVLTTKRFLLTERGKERSEAESAESNRMLGLAFQGQGQLDIAFDKFRKLRLDDGVMDLLYNLGLDFERKRQFNKAESVYRHMSEYKPSYKDLEHKLARAKQMSETVIFGGAGASHPGGALIVEGGRVEKPMLGRYQVEKELGKGAMGVVYLGKDPKISRVVAIKTLALSQEFGADELQEVKARFFREAETAGRLNHPNIVTIFDAGEEHDLAYIAMEFLQGTDLVSHTKADNLLPLSKVLSIVARVADALSYAHAHNVVHRDVKPANMMYEPETDTLKVTDFGIARITDSSKTKTGMVLGTPSYMSPEQLAGKKIDGRSDLFSLGVSLYQLTCGRLPFEGDSMAQLMFKIANEPPADIRGINPDLPECLIAIINKALAKQVEERYQTGAEMAQALKQCMANQEIVNVGV
ncbi:MAG TPA: serine/threonine-protein kinase [Burkholderiales bacterium]|nr:serine/threonine-protein kinase [Burkholderiales bacterium]